MDKIEVFLLGTPRVYINKKRYLFPYERVEGLFYYLVTKGKENKQVLGDIFWGDKYDGDKANKNYRNAVYHIRKAFGKDFLITEGKQGIQVNPEADLWIDLVEMHENLEILSGKENFWYLDHFEVKESEQFENFIRQKRVEIADSIYSLAEQELYKEKCRFSLGEEICKNLIVMDGFCEEYYQLLMEFYGKSGQKKRAESVYRELENLLEEELDEVPGEEITRTMERIRAQKEETGRNQEIKSSYFNEGGQTEVCRSLLEWISMFCDPADYRKLKYFSKIEESQIVEGIEELVHQGMIQEEEYSGRIFYSFRDEEERKKVYEGLSLTKRRSLHGIMAERFEKQFLNVKNEDILPKISYHFFNSGDKKKSNYYLREYLRKYLAVAHEYFPVLQDYDVLYNTETYLHNEKQIEFLYGQMEKYVEEYMTSVNPMEYEKERLELFLVMLVQSYVKIPDYEKSWKYLEELEKLQGVTTESRKQKAYLYMDTYQAENLIQVSEEGIALAGEKSAQQGYWKRLKGIGLVLKGDMEQGRQELSQAAEIFLNEEWREEWGSNAAVSYSWLGEISRLTGDCEMAIECYRKSLDMHTNVHNVSGKTLLYLHMAMGLFDMGNEQAAERYLRASVQSFEHLNVAYKRSTACLYEAVLLLRKGNFDAAAADLEKAGEYALRMRDPFERCLYSKILDVAVKTTDCPKEIREKLKAGRIDFNAAEEMKRIPSAWEKKYLEQFCVF